MMNGSNSASAIEVIQKTAQKNELQELLRNLKYQLDQAESNLKAVKRDSNEFGELYSKFVIQKRRLSEHTESTLASVQKRAQSFGVNVRFGEHYFEEISSILKGAESQNVIDSLSEAIRKLKFRVESKDYEAEQIQKKINSLICQIKDVQYQINQLG